jgi:GT2 family glycosyltransferase
MPSTCTPTPSSHSTLLSVIIVSYNTRQMTLDCLRALFDDLRGSGLHEQSEVWVVDNDSRDGSARAVREEFPDVRVVENPRNAGFGAANNLALRQASGQYLLLLNSDAFPKPGAVRTLIEKARSCPDVGVVGPRLLNGDGSLQVSCWKFPSPARVWAENLGLAALLPRHPVLGDYFRWAHDEEREVDFVVGACLLLPRKVYEKVGGFDEMFWMYAEETDWQKRIRNAGWRVLFTPHAQVTHLGGASGAADASQVNQAFWDSLDFYGRKHHGLLGLLLLRGARVVGSLARALAYTGLAVALPRRRFTARPKARLHWWLVARQFTRWKLKLNRAPSGEGKTA